MITQKILAQLLDKATDPDIHSVELSWESPNPACGPHPVIKITRKDDTYVPLQLCPKCNGDGQIVEPIHVWHGTPTSISTGVRTCNICKGEGVMPMIKSSS